MTTQSFDERKARMAAWRKFDSDGLGSAVEYVAFGEGWRVGYAAALASRSLSAARCEEPVPDEDGAHPCLNALPCTDHPAADPVVPALQQSESKLR